MKRTACRAVLGSLSPATFKDRTMQAHLKNALITTAIVLATVYALRRVSFTAGIVDTALQG